MQPAGARASVTARARRLPAAQVGGPVEAIGQGIVRRDRGPEGRLAIAPPRHRRGSLTKLSARLDHVQRRHPLGMPIGPRQACIDQQPRAVFHEAVTDEAELRLLAGRPSNTHAARRAWGRPSSAHAVLGYPICMLIVFRSNRELVRASPFNLFLLDTVTSAGPIGELGLEEMMGRANSGVLMAKESAAIRIRRSMVD